MKTEALATPKTLIDSLGRKITYLRVSLTERCNFKCWYCKSSARSSGCSPFSDDEICRLIRVFANLGVTKVRFTGGEPLLRNGIVELVKKTAQVDGITSVALSTNGFLLREKLNALVDSGLNDVNISLDSLDYCTFTRITGVDALGTVLDAIDAAQQSGVFPRVKINTVIMRGINDNEIPALAEWALNKNLELRFIEFMPTKYSGWTESLFVDECEIRARLGLDLKEESPCTSPGGPARTFRCGDYPGRIGFISAVSTSFCGLCNRVRLTSRGELVGCLFQNGRIDMKQITRDSPTDDLLESRLTRILRHPGFRRFPDRSSISDFQPSIREIGG